MSERKRGVVKWYSPRLGYGFVVDESGADYFVHWDDIEMDGFRYLNKKDEVTFIVAEQDGRLEAQHVKKI